MCAPTSSTKLVRDLDLFHLILEAYGWYEIRKTDHDPANLFDNRPEAVYKYDQSHITLTAKFHEPINMISLQMRAAHKSETVKLHFLYDDQPTKILEWLAAHTPTLTPENYQQLLKSAVGKCGMILLETQNKKIYELTPAEIAKHK